MQTAAVGSWLRRNVLSLGIAAGVFVLALEGGGYALTVRAPVAIGLFALIAVGVVALGWPRTGTPRVAIVAGALLLAYCVLSGLSIAWADSAEKAFTEFNRAGFYVAVFAVVVLAARPRTAGAWSSGLAGGIVLVAVIALASRLFPDVIGESDVSEVDPTDPRLSHPVNYWNGLATMMALAVPLLLASATTARTPRLGAIALAPLPILAGTAYLTSSRGGAAAVFVGVVAFLVLTNRRQVAAAAAAAAAVGSALAIAFLETQQAVVDGPLGSGDLGQGRAAAALVVLACVLTPFAYLGLRRVLPREISISTGVKRAALAAAVVVLVVGVVAADPGQRLDSFKETPGDFEGSYTQSHLLSSGGGGRWQFWSAAVDQFEAHPVLGDGAGSYEAWWAQHGSFAYFTRNAHSLFVETLGELGLVGLLLLLAFFATAIVAAVGRLRVSLGEDRPVIAALAAALLAFLLAAAIDWIWDLAVVGMLGVICVALLTGPATLSGDPGGVRRGIPARLALASVSALLLCAQAIPLYVHMKIEDSRDALKADDVEDALDDARAARSVQGWAASPHLQVALAEEYRRDYPAARESIEKALDRDESDWRLWAVASRIEQEDGDLDAARASYERAAELNPRSPLFSGK